jgi:hypothetical protein
MLGTNMHAKKTYTDTQTKGRRKGDTEWKMKRRMKYTKVINKKVRRGRKRD